jgi:hypothetical protein
MTIPSPRAMLRLAVLVGCAACDLSTPAEPQNPIDLVLDFCDGAVPIWFAYQNENMAAATRLFEDNDGTFRFTATNRVIIGMVFQNGADYHSEFIYATNEELAGLSATGCFEALGDKTVNGTVNGVGSSQVAVVSMSSASILLESGTTSYSLTNLPERALDLIASRQNVNSASRIADRIYIKRTQSFTNPGAAPPIDFAAGSDVVQAATLTASVSGILSGEFAYLQNTFFSQLRTFHSLSYSDALIDGAVAVAVVPQSSLAVGDYHDLFLISINAATGSVRGSESFFRAPATQTLALGPVLSDPTVTDISIGTGPVVMRLQLPTQLSYNDAVSVRYHQQDDLTSVSATQYVTSEYARGTPSVWVLELPILRAAPGWSATWELQSGMPVEWTVTAFGGRAELLFGARPEDGEFIRYAIRQSDPAAVAAPGFAGNVWNPRNGSLRSVYTNRLRLPTP